MTVLDAPPPPATPPKARKKSRLLSPSVERGRFTEMIRNGRNLTLVRLAVYYVFVIALGALIIATVPELMGSPEMAGRAGRLAGVVESPGAAVADGLDQMKGVFLKLAKDEAGWVRRLAGALDRALATVFATGGALVIVVPVVWVYMYTKRKGYDPSLVQSVVILPVVVAGILLVVKDSVALAFALAGVVAAVRFRNTLKDPKDTVYVFLAIGIGLATGVGLFDVALVLSMGFNVVVLGMWKYNVGAIYDGCHGPWEAAMRSGWGGDDGRPAPPPPGGVEFTSVGDLRLLRGRQPQDRPDAARDVLRQAGRGMKRPSALLVHVNALDAKDAVERTLAEKTRDWRLADVSESPTPGHWTLAYAVRLAKGEDRLDFLMYLQRRGAPRIRAAEYMHPVDDAVDARYDKPKKSKAG